MTARYATTHVFRFKAPDATSIADIIDEASDFVEDPAIQHATRLDFLNPTGAFKTLKLWNTNKGQIDRCAEAYRRVTCTVKSGDSEPKKFLLLKKAAFVMSGTTGELLKLLETLPNSVERIVCEDKDRLCVNYVRVGKIEGITGRISETQSVFQIGPLTTWWQASEVENTKSEKGWDNLPWDRDQITIAELAGLVKKAKTDRKKAWVEIKAEFF